MLKKLLAILFMFSTALAMAAVDVNKATEKELDAVKGVGPVTSKLIMAERKKGEFKNWQDFIARVKGIGDSRAAKLSAEGLTVNGAAYKPAAAGKDSAAQDSAAKDTKAKDSAAKDAKAKDAKDEKATAKADAGKPAASSAKGAASAKK